MNHPLNKEQVEVLFERETVLMGTENRVPIYRALALFGQDAVNYGKKIGRKIGCQKASTSLQRICPWLYNSVFDLARLSGCRQFL